MISAVIPAYNEAGVLPETLRALAHVTLIDEVVVVDDGSSDATAELAERHGAKCIRLAVNQGKGAALRAGIEAAEGDILVLLDADLGETAEQAGLLLAPVLAGDADLAIATFPVIPGKGGGLGLVVRLARWGIRRATGRTMAAPLSGQRAMRRSVLQTIGNPAPRFGVETAMTIDALRAGVRVLEVPTTMTHRVTGRDAASVRHRTRQLFDVARALWSRR
jgi:glycosyltransferase involved in cell wall biosynthesis